MSDHWRKYLVGDVADKRLERLLNRTAPSGRCWVWQGPVNANGYALISKKTYGHALGHRAVYEFTRGELIPGRHIHHACCNTSCLRPRHLCQVEASVHPEITAWMNRQWKIWKITQSVSWELIGDIRDEMKMGYSPRDIAEYYKLPLAAVLFIKNNRSLAED